MTKTLTTERLREILERRSPSLRWGEAEKIAAELLANREAQPVAEVLSSRSGNDTSTIDKALPAGTKVYTAPPAPAVPDEKAITPFFDTLALDTAKMVMCDVNRRSDFLGGDIQLLARIQCRVDEACRAAMLAQPVSQGYKLNSPETPDGWKLVHIDATRAMIDAAQRVEEDGYDAMYKAMLAAAPEGGNG